MDPVSIYIWANIWNTIRHIRIGLYKIYGFPVNITQDNSEVTDEWSTYFIIVEKWKIC